MVQAKAAVAKKGKKALTFTIDCAKPVEDKIMEIASFEKFLLDKIKVDGKTGEWGAWAGGRRRRAVRRAAWRNATTSGGAILTGGWWQLPETSAAEGSEC